jgi:hypothetical protein
VLRSGACAAVLCILVGCGGGLAERTPGPAATPAPTLEATAAQVRQNDEAFARKAALASDGDVRAQALALLDRVLRTEAANPANAWALAHGLLAYGRDFQATDGRSAVEVLAADFLEQLPLDGVEGGVPGFPAKRGEVRVEPHTDLVVKSLLEAGWGLDEALPTVKTTPRDLIAGSQARFAPNVPSAEAGGGGPRFADANDAPWTTDAWCTAAGDDAPPPASWTTASGVPVELEGVAGNLLATLETESYFLRTAKEAGAKVEKRKQGIFRYTCGGSHLFQGVASCAAAGVPAGDGTRTRLAKQIELYLYRVPIETRTVDAMLMQAPKFRSILYNQDIKFLGHLLEALGKVERDGLWTPSAKDRAMLEMAETRLVFHLLQQEKIGTYRPEALAKLARATDKTSQDPLRGFQFYLDLVGDAAHARHGLDIQAALRAKRTP